MTKKNKKEEKIEKQSFFDKLKEMDENDRQKSSEGGVLGKSTLNKRLLIVLIIFLFLFLLLAIYLVYFQLFKAEEVVKNDHNQRLRVDENKVKRGSIYDRNGNTIVTTKKDDEGNNYSVFQYGAEDATITGYNSVKYGKTGLEKTYNRELLNLSDGPVSQFKGMVIESGFGNDLHLSIDQTIQSLSYNYLKDHKGAIVVMDPKTGEVLSMVSAPTFDPNSLEADWENLIQSKDGPLINRATQGVYRPGSTMKIVTTAGIIENNLDQSFNDTGEFVAQGYTIKNFGDAIFGPLNLRSAFLNSVNTYFASKTIDMGKDAFRETAENFMFNKKYNFDLEISKPVIPFDELNDADLAMTGFGYGKTQVNPLHMCMVTSAIANGGVMMQPRLVNSITDNKGKVVEKAKDESLKEATSEDIANTIRDYMVATVNEGTAKGAYLQAFQVAGKTGTADREDGQTDARFVGFAPAYDPKIALAIVLENEGATGGEAAAPLAGSLIQDIFNSVNFNN